MALPNFLVCGAPKAGTTSLYHYLSQHPQVFMCSIKEPNYFCKEEYKRRDLEWYTSLFTGHTNEPAIGDVSPCIMNSISAPEMIAELLPNCRLLFLFRNPIERAHSHFLFLKMRGLEEPDVSFSDFIRDSGSARTNKIIELGYYDKYLSNFEKHIARSQICPILHDDMSSNLEAAVASVYDFIGVDASYAPDFSQRYNETVYIKNERIYNLAYKLSRPINRLMGRSLRHKSFVLRGHIRRIISGLHSGTGKQGKPVMNDLDKAFLSDLYRDSISNLSSYLRRDLSHWLDSSDRNGKRD